MPAGLKSPCNSCPSQFVALFLRDKSACRDNGKRFVVHADEKLTAFLELESAIRGSLIRIIGKPNS
jgi:hypothetical protein